MKIIEPFVVVEDFNANNMLRNLERAIRTCYKSEGLITADSAERIIKKMIDSGHLSTLEHEKITVRIICDRGVTHELVRHRIASYCLSGDTVVRAFQPVTGRTSKRWTVSQLYDWSKDPKRKGRLKLMRLRSMDNHQRLVPGKIISVVKSGKKKVFQLITESGRQIKATAKHIIFTPEGEIPLGKLSVGDFVFANGLPAYVNKEWLEERYINQKMTRPEVAKLIGISDSQLGKHIRRLGIKKPLSLRKNRKPGYGKKGMFSAKGKREISERMTGKGNHRWKGDTALPAAGRLRAQRLYDANLCCGCGCKDNVERHHVDGDPLNNAADNIRFLCQKCHKAWHIGQGVMTVFKDRIVSIESVGVEETYDIEMAAPNHNFVANGIVVHNSQESTRYCNYARDRFGNELTFIAPCFWSPDDSYYGSWYNACVVAEEKYLRLIELGAKPEQARSVLPNSLKTEIVTTFNLREWRHFFTLRCSPRAHPQMRQVSIPILRYLIRNGLLVLFEDLDVDLARKVTKVTEDIPRDRFAKVYSQTEYDARLENNLKEDNADES